MSLKKQKHMKKFVLILMAVFMMSCSVFAANDQYTFYKESINQLDVVLKKKGRESQAPLSGLEIKFPPMMKTNVTTDIKSLAFAPSGLLVNLKNNSRLSFIHEASENIFFFNSDYTLLEIYSDLFTKRFDKLNKKYGRTPETFSGMLDFKVALSLLDTTQHGYFEYDDIVVYFTVASNHLEAFAFNIRFPNELSRISAQGLKDSDFLSLISNISRLN